ncbi:DUF4124 domain-containing protein [Hydrogenophaga aquatica]
MSFWAGIDTPWFGTEDVANRGEHHMRISLLAPVLAIAFFSSGAHAQIFKCTGPGGTMELSDRPCAKGKSSVINVGPTNVLDGSHNRRLAAQQREERAAEAVRERFDAMVAAEQRQQEEVADSDRTLRQKLFKANVKAQAGARRAERQEAAARANAGTIDLRTGQHFPGVAGGVIDPRNGTFYHDTGAGYVNTRTGRFTPKH